MVEFGEKIKQLRELKGMTQQTMAEKLYVTRQAVSRWECGARYPDLLTAKKIAQILEVTVDELLSGEKFKKNVEKEAVLAKPAENIFQILLYTIAMISYLLMTIFGIYSFFSREALKGTPAGEITLLDIVTVLSYLINFLVMIGGLIFSAIGRLTAKKIGIIMATPYVVTMFVQGEIIFSLAAVICILIFFCCKEQRIPSFIIYAICVGTLLYIAYGLKVSLINITDLGFTVRCVHSFGKIAMAILLGYQTFVWNKKRKIGVKDVVF